MVRSFISLASIAAVGIAVTLAPAMATSTEEAKKICLERYNLEKEGGSIPVGMTKAKYMSQCTNSIKRNAQLEQDEQNAQNNSTTTGTNKTSFTNTNTSVGTGRGQ